MTTSLFEGNNTGHSFPDKVLAGILKSKKNEE
jgi:hypothetical protein